MLSVLRLALAAMIVAPVSWYLAAALQSGPDQTDQHVCQILKRFFASIPDQCAPTSWGPTGIIVAGIVLIVCVIVIVVEGKALRQPLYRRHVAIVRNALQQLNDEALRWLNDHYAGGRPPYQIGEALFAVSLVDRDHTGFTEVKEPLKPIVGERLRILRAKSTGRNLAQKLEPSHIIIFGLAVALAGVIWQWRRSPMPDPRIAQLEAQIETLKKQVDKPFFNSESIQPAPPQPVSSPAPSPVPTNPKPQLPTSPSAREELRTGLKAFRKILDEKCSPARQAVAETMSRWEYLAKTEGPAALAKRLEPQRDVIFSAIDDTNKLLYQYRDYDAVFRFVVGDNQMGALHSSLSMVIEDLNDLSKGPGVNLVRWLTPRTQELGEIAARYDQWIGRTDHKLGEELAELQK